MRAALIRGFALLSLACLMGAERAPPQPPQSSMLFRLIDNLVFVPAMINGHPAQVVIDSGTGGVGLNSRFAERMQLPIGRFLGNADGAGPAASPLYATRVNSLRVGSTFVGPLDAFKLDTTPFTASSGARVDAIIGEAFFRGHAVTFDYPRRLMTVEAEGDRRTRCAEPIRFQVFHGVPVVVAQASFDGGKSYQPYRLVVDLGTRHHSLLLNETFFKTPAGTALAKSRPPTQIGVGTGGAALGWTSRVSQLKVGATTYKDVDFAASRQLDPAHVLPIDGTLGVPFWKARSISFDYDAQTLCLGVSA